MSVYPPKDRHGKHRWEFVRDGQRYIGYADSAKQAAADEEAKKLELRDASHAYTPATMPATGQVLSPRISEWAGIFLADEIDTINRHPNYSERKKAQKIKDRTTKLSVALRYFGAKPEEKPTAAPARKNRNTTTKDLRPYHDLRLDEPITDVRWLLGFEAHLKARGLQGQSKNNLRNIMSLLYAHALQLEHRHRTGITSNPFRDLKQDVPRRRKRVLTTDEFMKIYRSAAPHLQLAMDIGSYAYALRVGEILRLTEDELDSDLTTITIWDHKSSDDAAKTVPIAEPLRWLLQQALADPARNAKCSRVIQYRGDGIDRITTALSAACERAGVAYGSQGTGVTFHTLRHTMATKAAKDGIADEIRRKMIGHKTMAATNWYSHANCETQRPALNEQAQKLASERQRWANARNQVVPPKSHQSPTKLPRLVAVSRTAGRR